MIKLRTVTCALHLFICGCSCYCSVLLFLGLSDDMVKLRIKHVSDIADKRVVRVPRSSCDVFFLIQGAYSLVFIAIALVGWRMVCVDAYKQ